MPLAVVCGNHNRQFAAAIIQPAIGRLEIVSIVVHRTVSVELRRTHHHELSPLALSVVYSSKLHVNPV